MCFSYFFPISGRRPEIPVLAGGQGRKAWSFNSLIATPILKALFFFFFE